MTTQTETKAKKIPDLQIFEKGADGKNVKVGAGFNHGKGGGCNLLIGGKRYSVFPTRHQSQ